MGQDISVKFSAITASGKAVICNVDRRAHRAAISSGAEYAKALINLVYTLSESGEEEWHTYYRTTRDYEPEFRKWAIIKGGDETPQSLRYRRPEGEKWHNEPEAPEWYIEYPQPQVGYIRIYADDNMDFLWIGGYSPDEVEDLAQTIFNVLSEYGIDYVRYSDTHVVSAEGIEAIETFSERVQKEVFGVEPPFANATYELFQWDADKREFTMHPELKAIYGDVESAVRAYDRGEFALWRTGEGLNFYQTWRGDHTKNAKMETLKSLGIALIEGKKQKENPIWKRAQEEFRKGAFQYKSEHGHTCIVGESPKGLTYKVVLREDGVWQEVPFKLGNYYPIGFSMSREILSLTGRATPSWESLVNEIRTNWEFKVSPGYCYTARWIATYNNEVLFDEVIQPEE